MQTTLFSRILKSSRAPAGLLAAALLLFLLHADSRAQNSGPARDAWQHPNRVMNALRVHNGTVVADVGCGAGYFTFQLARRVGSQGHVYAEDLLGWRLDQIREQARRERIKQITTIQGAPNNPRLPANGLDVVLAVNTYHEWHEHQAMLQSLYRDLRPGGVFGLIDASAPSGRPRSYYYEHHRMPEQIERTEAIQAGFHFLRQEPGFTRPSDGRQFYFLLFQKPR
jgi:ubiquinone/menaquinone biosynthesis C-methylase UbiE